ncbi:hypothetical protein EJ03DRAFT_378818 [Teratosphaeria nubilosa]|uniref:Uncharacterized protein n=1 Tax=Teratosphaeria nubilosa TaxID=161662 RepID=A0A6G1KV59_9PEZI|nr:hypothetical protein EJ03DRAFT_378818 [Teratosphaeria nubilosa]
MPPLPKPTTTITTTHHLTRKTKPTKQPPPFLTLHYQPHPTPHTNLTTHHSTTEILRDPTHPFHPRTTQRLQNLHREAEAPKLHHRVHATLDVSASAYIRKWAARRLRNALVRTLREQGFDEDGRRRGVGGEGLSGAVLVVLRRHPLTLTATREEVGLAAEYVLSVVREKSQRSYHHR